MFSGIIEELGIVTVVEDRDGLRRMCVRASEIVSGLEVGASVAIDGACHTITGLEEDTFCVESMTTTLSRTIAAGYRVGDHLNLERALSVGGRVDGHFVQGHVDAMGSLVGIEEDGQTRLMDFLLPTVVAEVTVLRGSIAINGVSLTVSTMPSPGVCRVGIIPFTWDHTNLRLLEPGASVNLEGDLIGKHVGKMLAAREGASHNES